jgi:hypothetical protein
MKTKEKIFVALVVTGLILKSFLIPGGGALMTLSLYLLSIYYLVTYWLKRGLLILIGISLFITVLGILFRLQFYQYAYYMLSAGLIFCLVTQTYINMRNRNSGRIFFKSSLKRIIIVASIGFILLLIPSRILFAFFHRNRPEYVRAVFNTWDDPENEKYQEELRNQESK